LSTASTTSALSEVSTMTETTSVGRQQQLDYETKHVHEVYDEIAAHFSETRHKVRPLLIYLED
jgi:hypothetical protein